MNRRRFLPEALSEQSLPSTPRGLSRREFFKVSAAAGGGLLISMYLPGCGRETSVTAADEPFEPNAWVRIDPDNAATVTVHQSEMGQAVRTTLALIVAEELDLDWSRVAVAQAPNDPERYGRQGTGGSGSVRRNWTSLREAGARARTMLVAAAAEQFGVPADQLETRDSHVLNPSGGQRLGYGELAAAAATQPIPESVTLKTRDQYRLLGQEHGNVDVPAITRGEPVYGSDVSLPNMLYAVVERTPVHGGKVKSFDGERALAVPGVKQVFEVPAVGGATHVHSGVAVVAESTWAALQGRDALQIEWDPGPHAGEASAEQFALMRELTSKPGNAVVNRVGDPDAVIAAADDVVTATYEVPFISHATMEPQNCTAEFKDGRCLIISPTQFPNWSAYAAAQALGIEQENVELRITDVLGGGFGRRINPDYTAEAALIAREVNAPVKTFWSREDDLRHDFYRPPAVHTINATLGEDGYPTAWRQRFSSAAISGTYESEVNEDAFGVDESDGAGNMLYRIPNRSCEYSYLPCGITRGWWRAVHTTHGTFAVESFIDELAERAGIDPLEYRLALIGELEVDRPEQDEDFPFVPERLKGVLRLAAERAEWGKPLPAGHGVGIACGIDHLSYAAEVIEVSLKDGQFTIEKVVCAVDCGPVINPNGARAQLEGGIHQGLSAALRERLTVKDGAIEQGNFDEYSILRIDEAPRVIETVFAKTDAHPTGLGEPSVPPVAPALANAVYRVTGKRYRTLPIEI